MSWHAEVDSVIAYIEAEVRDRVIEPRQAANELHGILRLLARRDICDSRKYVADRQRLEWLIAHYESWAETTAELMSA